MASNRLSRLREKLGPFVMLSAAKHPAHRRAETPLLLASTSDQPYD